MTHENQPYSSGTAFLLWLSCFLGFCGIHRFYLGKPISGTIYLLTFGLLGIGQFFDLFLMRGMVRRENLRALSPMQPMYMLPPAPLPLRPAPAPTPKVDPEEQMRMTLLGAARRHGGMLSVSQGVMASGRSFKDVEQALDDMAISGFVDIDNDPKSGAVVYTFPEFA